MKRCLEKRLTVPRQQPRLRVLEDLSLGIDFPMDASLIEKSLERIYLSPPHMSESEVAKVLTVFDSNWIAPIGPHLDEFESLLSLQLGGRPTLAVSSGTAALHLALRYLGLQPGDEVVCSTLTFCASANPIVYEQASPVFIDSERSTWNMDPNLLSEELASCAERNQLPKAVIVVDIFGQCADMDAIQEIASRYEVPVIEDAAEALGSTYKEKPAGSFGWASILSFNGNKIITTSGGGALCSDDPDLIEQARRLATQAREPVPWYEHSQIGYNYRLSNVLAAIGAGQAERLDQLVDLRRQNFDHYQKALGRIPGIEFMPEPEFSRSNRWLTVMNVDPESFGMNTSELMSFLEKRNIEARMVWKPLHLQPSFQGCRYRGGKVAQDLFENGLCLPSGSSLSLDQRERVSDAIVNAHCRASSDEAVSRQTGLPECEPTLTDMQEAHALPSKPCRKQKWAS